MRRRCPNALGGCSNVSPDVATTPIRDVVQTIQVVRTMQKTLTDLTEVVERLGARIIELDKRLDAREQS